MFSVCLSVYTEHKKVRYHQKQVSNINPFPEKYNWDGTDYPTRRSVKK